MNLEAITEQTLRVYIFEIVASFQSNSHTDLRDGMAYTIHYGLQNFVSRGTSEGAIKILCNKCSRVDITGLIPPTPPQRDIPYLSSAVK
jgi:hypothetical protein